jgi:hypothetical protein
MDLPREVDTVVRTYLAAVDAEAPSLVEGLYLTGSTALGEFRPHTSDIDFVAVSARPPDASSVAALDRAHRRLRARMPRPFFDGRYVTWDDLSGDPRQAAPGPYSYEGRLRRAGRGDCDPVAWHTIAQCGVRCRGPEPAQLTIWTDAAALRSWTYHNFDNYWRPLLGRARRPVDLWWFVAFTSYGAAWLVLGVCRLHYTLATGAVVAKEAAGEYGLTVFPERWHRALNEALRVRRADRARADAASALVETIYDLRLRWAADGGSLYQTPIARRDDVLAFTEMAIADANRRFGGDAVAEFARESHRAITLGQ